MHKEQDSAAGENKDGESNESEHFTVKLEDGTERKVTREDALNLIKQGQEATRKTQQVANILDTCRRYDADPDEFVSQASAAFDVVFALQQQGLVDKDGNITIPDNLKREDGSDKGDDPAAHAAASARAAHQQRQDGAIAKALTQLTDQVKKLENNQDYLAKVHLEGQIKTAHPDFSEADIARTFAVAKAQKVALAKAAEVVSQEKVVSDKQARERYAKEFGVDLEKFDKNKLNQQSAEGGAGLPFEGKRFSFRGGKDTIDPKEAMRLHFRAADSAKQ